MSQRNNETTATEQEIIDLCGCIDCYAINPDYITTKQETLICLDCGGIVLTIQGLLDKIADLKSDLELQRIYHDPI